MHVQITTWAPRCLPAGAAKNGQGAGFARTGAAHHNEMLGQKIVDHQARGHAGVLEQRAHLDAGDAGRGINAGQVVTVGQKDRIADAGQLARRGERPGGGWNR